MNILGFTEKAIKKGKSNPPKLIETIPVIDASVMLQIIAGDGNKSILFTDTPNKKQTIKWPNSCNKGYKNKQERLPAKIVFIIFLCNVTFSLP